MRLLGNAAAHLSGFHEALALEDAAQPGAVLKWARTPGTPSTVRAIVEMAQSSGPQGGRFDEAIVATAHGPAVVKGLLQTVHLRARRRGGAICYRLTGSVDTVLPSSSLPLERDVVHKILCGDREALVVRSLNLLISTPEPKCLARNARPLSQAGPIWMPHVTSRFYDFAVIEAAIHRAVTERALKHPSFNPPER